MGSSDEELIRRFKRGDEKSFKELVERYQSRVYSIVLGMIGDRSDTEDLCQEIFVKVYRNLDKFKGKSKFYTWLYRIAVNTCINAQNGQKRKPASISLSYPMGKDEKPLLTKISESSEKCSMEILKNKELGSKMKSAIDSLSDGLKEVFIMREIEDLSYKELARIFQCSEGTIKSRLFRAREKLKEELMPYLT